MTATNTAAALALIASIAACNTTSSKPTPAERGKYLVTAAGCNDCHTPLIMGPKGPERDANHVLAGHPASMALPPAPAAQGPWMYTAAATMTAWSGPWGVSFTANLTPDKETGLGTWDAQTFIATLRNARHMGKGRPLLPPMPAEMIAQYTDEDLTAIFAYLQSLPPVKNRVPDPIPPTVATAAVPSS
ncbi:MAG TPA: c-type cytochrome [Kofleriaceae bacterium]|nr:c-type cytochrome [Kofleriaceae bacterium]